MPSLCYLLPMTSPGYDYAGTFFLTIEEALEEQQRAKAAYKIVRKQVDNIKRRIAETKRGSAEEEVNLAAIKILCLNTIRRQGEIAREVEECRRLLQGLGATE